MKRIGTVAEINLNRGMVAIATDEVFTIIELLSEFELEVGDSISWSNGFGLGHEIYENLTKNISKKVYVQNHNVSKANLYKQLLM
jgi:hypothetical protein